MITVMVNKLPGCSPGFLSRGIIFLWKVVLGGPWSLVEFM